jgi:hypothetical protein
LKNCTLLRHYLTVDFINQWESLQVGAKALLALRPEIYGNIAEEK